MSQTTPIPWPTKHDGRRVSVTVMRAKDHLADLDTKTRRTINKECRRRGSHFDKAVKHLWPTLPLPPLWESILSQELGLLRMAVRKDMDELSGMDQFLRQQFEGGWFELRIVWESLGWCRRRETLGASKTKLKTISQAPAENHPGPMGRLGGVAGAGSSAAVEARARAPAPTPTPAPAPAPSRAWLSSRPWEL